MSLAARAWTELDRVSSGDRNKKRAAVFAVDFMNSTPSSVPDNNEQTNADTIAYNRTGFDRVVVWKVADDQQPNPNLSAVKSIDKLSPNEMSNQTMDTEVDAESSPLEEVNAVLTTERKKATNLRNNVYANISRNEWTNTMWIETVQNMKKITS